MTKETMIIERGSYTIRYEVIDGGYYQNTFVLDKDSNDICHFSTRMGGCDDNVVRVYYIGGRFGKRIRTMKKRYTDGEFMAFDDYCNFLEDILRFIDKQN